MCEHRCRNHPADARRVRVRSGQTFVPIRRTNEARPIALTAVKAPGTSSGDIAHENRFCSRATIFQFVGGNIGRAAQSRTDIVRIGRPRQLMQPGSQTDSAERSVRPWRSTPTGRSPMVRNHEESRESGPRPARPGRKRSRIDQLPGDSPLRPRCPPWLRVSLKDGALDGFDQRSSV